MSSKKWLHVFFISIFLMGGIPYLLTYIFLTLNFENNTYDEIVTRQIKNRSIYGTALNQNTFAYKLSLIRAIKPEIIVLGSSRVMQFREESFTTSFVNAGGSMNYLNEGYQFLQELYTFHKPKYIILGLDFWWFNDSFSQPFSFPYHQNQGTTIDYHKIYKTLSWLASGKIGFTGVKNMWSQEKIRNRYTDYDNLGFSAIATSDGYRSDGSYLYAKTLFGVEKSDDQHFLDTLSRIENGNNRFEYGKTISNSRIKYFRQIINKIQENNTRVILLIPPVSNTVYQKMKGYNYTYIHQFQKFISEQNIENYNYHKLSLLTKDDCECIDGFHGGDVVYNRILKNMYDRNSSISPFLNIQSIEENIKKFRGKTLTLFRKNRFQLTETDFLKLGCEK